MSKTSATIIDFRAYRLKRRAAPQPASDNVWWTAAYSAVPSFYLLWPFLIWIPFGLLDLPRAEHEPS